MSIKKTDRNPIAILNRKAVLWIIGAVVLVLFITGIFLLIKPARTIDLPDAEAVINAELEQYDDKLSIGQVTLTDKTDIEILLSALSGAGKTLQQSVHDAPLETDYLSITLNLNNEMKRLYVYSRNASHYVEEPYIAVYKLDKSASIEIYSLYTAK